MSAVGLSAAQQYLLHTRDLDCVREAVSSILTTHRVSLTEASALDARFSATRVSKIILMRLEYGAAVKIDVDPPKQPFHLIQWSPQGNAIVLSGRDEIVITPDVASLPDPRRSCVMRLAPDCATVAIRIDADHLQRHLQSLIGRPLHGPVIFDHKMDLRTNRSQSWRAALDLLHAETQRPGGLLEHPLVSAQIESVILTGLLLAQDHNFTPALHAEQRPAAPRSVKRVLERIEANPEFPLTIKELADDAGVSVRALQKSFHDLMGCSPMAYLREIRLNRARKELANADPAAGASVTEIALDWGFTHLGRFSVEYRRRFGESPSQTLRR